MVRQIILFLLLCAGISSTQARAQQDSKDLSSSRKRVIAEIALFNPANNHFYQTFTGNYTWGEATKLAAEHTYNGIKGHLATVKTQQECDFIVQNIWVYDYWIGGYRDPQHINDPSNHGWRWVTGEPIIYANWNDHEPSDKDLVPLGLEFYAGSLKWSARLPTVKGAGYLVEYDNTAPVPSKYPKNATQHIDAFLSKIVTRYEKVSSYQATVEFTFKAFTDTVDNVKADLIIMGDGRFRLEGRGENGKLLAICDGARLMLATTAPGERMKFDVKPMPPLATALRQAFSLLTSSPKPPSITDLMTGTLDQKTYAAHGVVGELTEGDSPEQLIRVHTRVKMSGEDPEDGSLVLSYSLDQAAVTSSELDFRFKLYPYSARETHTNIRFNEDIPESNFVLVITKNATQVDDLGEDADTGISFSAPPK